MNAGKLGSTIMSNKDMLSLRYEHNVANDMSAAQNPLSMHRQTGMFSNNPQSDFTSGLFFFGVFF